MADAVQFQNLRPDLSVTDMAYQILKERREPMRYRDLVETVLAARGVRSGQDLPKLMAKIHTEISLDNRFLSQGGGLCGLREWSVKPPAYKVLEVSSGDRPKPGERLRKELVTIDEDYQYEEELIDEEPIGEPEDPEGS
ncbi:MAG: DNA-directed RNA polymerase subunit delta [Candidatus Fermentithermobacillus carboniphilus]|uniref:RNAP delta factor n=1 Tax=Candidatus Fermentithermobacillus carboniphilus TaxID=3085328 RepID=A0AAT9LBG8_9FIRM|nr:MAG: DNA-directed RNA polymerase subunit delta [Candidatus Fermentithermobacillus carboniphilus]